jgi:hypothetical protein
MDSKLRGDEACWSNVATYRENVRRGELRFTVVRAYTMPEQQRRVFFILAWCHIFQVFYSIVVFFSVLVIDLLSMWTRANKGPSDKSMNHHVFGFADSTKHNMQITKRAALGNLSFWGICALAIASFSPVVVRAQTSKTGHLVVIFKSFCGDLSPFFDALHVPIISIHGGQVDAYLELRVGAS